MEKRSDRTVGGIKKISPAERLARREALQSSDYSDLTPEKCLLLPEQVRQLAVNIVDEETRTVRQKFNSGEISQEETDQMIHDLILETLIAITGKWLNEGNDALIIEFKAGNLDEELIGQLVEQVPELREYGKDSIAKLLKVFKHGLAPEEAKKQTRIRKIIAESPASKYVEVPAVRATADVKLTAEQARILAFNCGHDFGAGVGFIVMDEVPGVDLTTKIYQKMIKDYLREDEADGFENVEQGLISFAIQFKLKKRGNFFKLKNQKMEMRLMTLATRLGNHLERTDFATAVKEMGLSDDNLRLMTEVFDLSEEIEAGKKLRSEKDFVLNAYIDHVKDFNLLDHIIVDNLRPNFRGKKKEFLEEIRNRAAYSGLIRPECFEALKQALQELHKSGVYHCDLHERNIMIGDDGKLYLIDFAKANIHGDTSGADSNYVHQGEQWLSDDTIVTAKGLLQLASLSPEDRPQK